MKILINRDMLLGRNPPSQEEVLERIVTPAQREVFLVVDEWWKKYGFAPSYRDIAYVRGKGSLNNTKRIVDRLVDLGALKRLDGKGRTLRPVYLNFKNLD
jgi:SOS-response transcriptional repressor LexA